MVKEAYTPWFSGNLGKHRQPAHARHSPVPKPAPSVFWRRLEDAAHHAEYTHALSFQQRGTINFEGVPLLDDKFRRWIPADLLDVSATSS